MVDPDSREEQAGGQATRSGPTPTKEWRIHTGCFRSHHNWRVLQGVQGPLDRVRPKIDPSPCAAVSPRTIGPNDLG